MDSPLTGFVERLRVGLGFLVVQGWIGRRGQPPIAGHIEVRVNGRLITSLVGLDFRPDLLDQNIGFGHAAFHLCAIYESSIAEEYQVSVRIDNEADMILPILNEAEPFIAEGSIDLCDGDGIIGWVFDPAMAHGGALPKLLINNKHTITIETFHERVDVPYRNAEGHHPWGFRVTAPELGVRLSSTEIEQEITVDLTSNDHRIARFSKPSKLLSRAERPEITALLRPRSPPKVGTAAIPAALPASSPPKTVTHQSLPDSESRQKLLVISWDMGHNPVGRAYLLADIASRRFATSLVGPLFPAYGKSLWEPIARQTRLSVSTFDGGAWPSFLRNALDIVFTHQPDVVYVSKARMPSLLIGLLFWMLKRVPIVVDVDDHELSFFRNDQPIEINSCLEIARAAPATSEMPYSELWTRLAEGLLRYIPVLTVSNPALQKRFGGLVVRHARDETSFIPNDLARNRVRGEFRIPLESTVVLFVGTPREHKGVIRVAKAVIRSHRKDLHFVIVGSPTDDQMRKKLAALNDERIHLVEDQPFDRLAEVVALADAICVLQDVASKVSHYQIPAKITEALALGIEVFATRTAPLADLIDQGVITAIDSDEQLDGELSRLRVRTHETSLADLSRRSCFLSEFSYEVNASRIALAFRMAKESCKGSIPLALHTIVTEIFALYGIEHPRLRTTRAARTGPYKVQAPIDMVFFWKQNDTGIYGRRHDMLIKYFMQSHKIRRIMQFDRVCSLSELDRNIDFTTNFGVAQGNLIYSNIIKRALKLADEPNIFRRTFICRDGNQPQRLFGKELPGRSEYPRFVRECLAEASMGDEAIAWVCPVVLDFPAVQDELKFQYIVSDIIDDQRKFKAVPDYAKRVEDNYRAILGISDLAISNTRTVAESFSNIKDVHLITNGAEDFTDADQWPLPSSLEGIKRPIIGYVGNLRDRVDFELVERVAKEMPSSSIVLIGSTQGSLQVLDLARNHPNIMVLGVKPYDEAIKCIKHFDVAIMPHLDNELSQSMNPLKLFVYYALGVPIVTTMVANIDEIGPYVRVATDHDAFIREIRSTLTIQRDFATSPREDVMSMVSWKARVAEIFKLIGCEDA